MKFLGENKGNTLEYQNGENIFDRIQKSKLKQTNEIKANENLLHNNGNIRTKRLSGNTYNIQTGQGLIQIL